MEFIDVLIMGLFAVFLGSFTVILLYLYNKKDEFLQDSVSYVLDYLANDEEMQKNLYTIGGLVAQGVKGGIGLPAQNKNPNLKQIGTNLLGQFLQNIITQQINSPPSTSSTSSTYPQKDILAQKNRDKW